MASYNLGELIWKITGDASAIKKSLHESEKATNKFTNVLKKAGSFIASFFAVQKIVQFVKSSIQAYGTQELAISKLNAVLKSTQGIAGLTSNELQKMASSLQAVTTYGDETIMEGQSLLLTFTKIGKDVFPAATEAMLDMSTVMGQDLKSSAIQIGKALNDPIQGVTALRRVGVQLEQQQEDQIKKFMELGDITSAQKIILGELNTQMGGASRAAAETLSGKIQQLSNSFGDMKETLVDVFVGDGTGTDIVGQLNNFVVNTTIGIRKIQLGFVELKSFMFKMAYDISKLPIIGGTDEQKKAARAQYIEILKEELALRKKIAGTGEGDNTTKNFEKTTIAAGETKKELIGIDALLEEMKTAGYWDSYTDQISRSEKEASKLEKTLEELTAIERFEALNSALQGLSNNIISILSNISNYYDAVYQNRLDHLDQQMEAELEAAGVAEDTAVEAAQAQLDAAIEAGDAEAEAEARKALKKAQIEEKYAKKRAKLEYEAQMQAWKYEVAIATAQIPLSVMNAIASGAQAPWFMQPGFMIAMGTTAGIATAANLAAVLAAQPEPPKFATGGIVPGNRSTGDNTLVQTTPGEMILNDQQQAELFNMANGAGNVGTLYRVAPMDKEVFFDELYQASKRGDLYIYDGAVVNR